MRIEFEYDYEHNYSWEGDDGSYTEGYKCPLNSDGVYIRDVDCTPGFGEVDEGFYHFAPCLERECECITECHVGVTPIIECKNPCSTQ